jgi:putative hemolysin
MAIELAIILLLVLTNGVFSLAEMAVVSARKTRLKQQADEGDKGAQAALALAHEPTRFLSTVQVVITLIGILTGALGGATIAAQIAAWLGRFPALAPYSQAIGVTVVVLVITYLSLVLGELVPKRMALNRAERLAAWLAPGMNTLTRLLTVPVSLLSASTEFVLRLLGNKPSDEPAVTADEVRMMIYEGTRLGIFEATEQEIVERVFRLGDRRVSTMMTYRTDIVWLDVEDSLEENLQKVIQAGHSRFPVCEGKPDAVLGIVRVKDVFAQTQGGRALDLRALLRPALFFPETISALQVLERFKEKKEHTALVVDEFGGIAGLVTMNDVLEAIVGDIPSVEEEDQEPEVVRRADGSLLLDGMLSIHELKDVLQLKELPDEEQGDYETLSGLLMAQLGRIPITGDIYEWEQLKFEVVDMDGYRVDKVLVSTKR